MGQDLSSLAEASHVETMPPLHVREALLQEVFPRLGALNFLLYLPQLRDERTLALLQVVDILEADFQLFLQCPGLFAILLLQHPDVMAIVLDLATGNTRESSGQAGDVMSMGAAWTFTGDANLAAAVH